MAIIAGIDYGNLIFSKRYKLDQEAYSEYYKDNFDTIKNKSTLTFNSWYGTVYHKKYITQILRKLKLEKLKIVNEDF